jgi:hypothetical protein
VLHPPVFSLLVSAVLGEALLFLATNSPTRITDRRVTLMRELSRLELRHAFGGDDREPAAYDLLAGEQLPVVCELRRATSYGVMTVLQRYRVSITPHGLGRDAA